MGNDIKDLVRMIVILCYVSIGHHLGGFAVLVYSFHDSQLAIATYSDY